MIDCDEIVRLYKEGASISAISRLMGVHRKTVQNKLDKSGVKRPNAVPLRDPVEGMEPKRTSTLVGPKGEVKQQWIIHERDKQDLLRSFEKAIEALTEPLNGLSEPAPAPEVSDASLMTIYQLGDPHLEMVAYKDQTGEEWNQEIAERVTYGVASRLIERSPNSEIGALLTVGDTFHTNGEKPTTPNSGNQLDRDGHIYGAFRMSLRLFKAIIELGKRKHKLFKVFIVPGNHDGLMARMLAQALAEYYSNDERVEICTDLTDRTYFQFGKSLVGLTHGDKTKPEQLASLMALEQKRAWADCEHYYWKCGHWHHKWHIKDMGRVNIEYLRTLASGDAWHVGAGYLSIKDASCVVLHETYGEWERHTLPRIAI